MERAASFIETARSHGFESMAKYATADLAYIVEVSRYQVKVGGRWMPLRGSARDGHLPA